LNYGKLYKAVCKDCDKMSFRGGEVSAERLAELLIQWCNETKGVSFQKAYSRVLEHLSIEKIRLHEDPRVYSRLFYFIHSRRSKNPDTDPSYYTGLAALIVDPYRLDE